MKTLALILALLVSTTACADIFKVPFECYPQDIQAAFAKHGYNLEIGGSHRTKDSWGFVRNQGQNYEIVTYRPASEEELKKLTQIIWEAESWQNPPQQI